MDKMSEEDYVAQARRTLSKEEDYLEHMAYGLVTESAEIMDALKKHKFYGRDLDVKNVKEEIGDLCWYLFQLAHILGYSIEKAKVDNIKKLKHRYPAKFEDVVNRDINELNHIEG